ncbi:MAG: glycosyltransferase family 4 protein [Thermoanaerobaculia bacterium]
MQPGSPGRDPNAAGRSASQLAVWYSPHALGGVETFLQRYVSRDASAVVAAVQSLEGPMKPAWPAGSSIVDWTSFWPAFMRESDPRHACEAIVRTLLELRPAIVNLNDCVSFALGAVPLLRAIRPYCVVVDLVHVEPQEDDFVRHRLRYLPLLDGLVATSRNAIERLRASSVSARDLPMRYIPYGVPAAQGQRSPSTRHLRLLYVGRLQDEQKRVSLLPRILRLLADRGREFHLTLVGDGPERARLEQEFAALGLRDSVTFAGLVRPEAVGAFCLDNDVLLNVSRYEGFPITIIEAMSAGCVPLLTNLPSVDSAVLMSGRNCLTVPVDAPERAADLLSSVTPSELEEMSVAARRTGTWFTVERMVGEYHAFFEELASSRPTKEWPSRLAVRWDPSEGNPWLPPAGMRGRMAAMLRKMAALTRSSR